MKEPQEIKIYHLTHDGKKIDIPVGITLRYDIVQSEFRSLVYFPKGYAMMIHGAPEVPEVKKFISEKIVRAIFEKPSPEDHLGHLLRRDFEGLLHYWEE